jgi:pimeloyl-ACP methyl ester carboxylesterase
MIHAVRTEHVVIAYEEHGPADGTPVLLLHGFPDSPRTWDGVVAALGEPAEHVHLAGTPRSPRCITPYQRGCGASRALHAGAVAGQVAALAQDVLDLADALGLDRFVVAGHDWGSRAAAGVAVLAPHRLHAVLLLATPYGAGETTAALRLAQAHACWYQWYFHTPQGSDTLARERQPFCRHLWRVWSPQWRFADKDFAAAAASWDNEQFVDTVLHYYRHRWGNALGCPLYAAQQALLDAAPALTVPATLVVGTTDAVNLPAAARGTERHHAAGLRVVAAEGAGHFIQREQPHLVAGLIRDCLPRHPPLL